MHEIAGKDFLLAYEPDFDISTAAGPQVASGSSGLLAYADAPGELMAGVNSLGGLEQTAVTKTISFLAARTEMSTLLVVNRQRTVPDQLFFYNRLVILCAGTSYGP